MGKLNTLIPMKGKHFNYGNSLAEGMKAGAAMRSAPARRQLLEAQASKAQRDANGELSPAESARLEFERQRIEQNDRRIAIQEEQAQAGQWVADPQNPGVFFNPKNGEVKQLGNGEFGSKNDFYRGKITQGEGQAGNFASRMAGAMEGIDSNENVVNQEGVLGMANQDLLGKFSGYFASEERQKYEAAKQAFLLSHLRDDSGAAIGTSEYKDAEKLFYPQLGEGPEVIADKKRRRQSRLKETAAQAGRNYDTTEVQRALGNGPQAGVQSSGVGQVPADDGAMDSVQEGWIGIGEPNSQGEYPEYEDPATGDVYMNTDY